MESNVKDFFDEVEAENYEQKNFGGSLAEIQKKGTAEVLKPMVAMMVANIKANKLAAASLLFTDADIQVRLETGIVNLPLRYLTAMQKMLADDDTLPINVYSVIESPDVNVSSLRIDKVASADDFVAHEADMAGAIADWLDTQLEAIKTNQEAKENEEAQPDDSDVNDK